MVVLNGVAVSGSKHVQRIYNKQTFDQLCEVFPTLRSLSEEKQRTWKRPTVFLEKLTGFACEWPWALNDPHLSKIKFNGYYGALTADEVDLLTSAVAAFAHRKRAFNLSVEKALGYP